MLSLTRSLEPAGRARAVLVAAGLLWGLGGCERLVMLGTDCPDQAGCQDGLEPVDMLPPSSDGDAAVPTEGDAQAGSSDGSIVLGQVGNQTPLADAGILPKGVTNASFELSNPNLVDTITNIALDFTVGTDVYVNNVAGAVPVVGDIFFSRVAPWYACNSGTWAVERAGPAASEYRPTLGKSFIRMTRVNNPLEGKATGLFQDVEGGFEAGLAYSFQVDALGRADENATVQFRIGATNTPCSSSLGGVSALSEPLEKQPTWKTLCLTFVPTERMKTLYIVPQIVGGSHAATAVALDNLRPVDRCP